MSTKKYLLFSRQYGPKPCATRNSDSMSSGELYRQLGDGSERDKRTVLYFKCCIRFYGSYQVSISRCEFDEVEPRMVDAGRLKTEEICYR